MSVRIKASFQSSTCQITCTSLKTISGYDNFTKNGARLKYKKYKKSELGFLFVSYFAHVCILLILIIAIEISCWVFKALFSQVEGEFISAENVSRGMYN